MNEEKIHKQKKQSMADICHKIAEGLVSKYNFKTVPGKEEVIWVYDEGIYKPIGKNIIKVKVEQKLGALCKTHYVTEIINKVARMTYISRDKFSCNDLNLICLENGVLDIKKDELLPHSPDYYFTYKIPIIYNKDAKCKKITDFMEDVLYEDDIDVVQEWFGYCLWRNYFLKKGIIFVGGGDTGKTTMLNLLIKFIGEDNMSGVSLQAISTDKFSVANLYNKHLNAYDDLSSTDLEDTGRFKMITGGGWISGQFKFGDEFSFKNFAKLTFSTNKIPLSKRQDDDQAYYTRWLVIRFDQVFNKSNVKTNKTLINELTTKEEMSGLLNWALIGLRRLLREKDFSYNKDLNEIRELITRNSSDIAKFVQDCCEKGDAKCWISKEEMFEHYKEYSELNDFTSVTKEMLGRKLPDFCNYIIDSRGGERGQMTGWRFVKVKEIKPIFGI